MSKNKTSIKGSKLQTIYLTFTRFIVRTEKVETLVSSVTFKSALVIGLTLVLIIYLSIAILEIGPSTKTEYCHYGLLTH